MTNEQILWGLIDVFILAFLILAVFIFRTAKEVEDDDTEKMARTFYFKITCGEIIQEDGKTKFFTKDDAMDFAKKHPYHYVKSVVDKSWTFANNYFTPNEDEPHRK